MGRKPRHGRCVHCTAESDELTWDHLLPRSWYPDTTPANLEKWKFPSCVPCNKHFGKIERDILVRFGLCVDPKDPRAAGISERALRSIRPECASNEQDRRAREKLRAQIRQELIDFGLDLPTAGVFPNFGPLKGVEYRRFLGIQVSAKKLETLGEKFIRGVTYLRERMLITDQHQIEIHF